MEGERASGERSEACLEEDEREYEPLETSHSKLNYQYIIIYRSNDDAPPVPAKRKEPEPVTVVESEVDTAGYSEKELKIHEDKKAAVLAKNAGNEFFKKKEVSERNTASEP